MSLIPLIWGSAVVSTAISCLLGVSKGALPPSLCLASHADPVAGVAVLEVAAYGGLRLLEDLLRHRLLDLAPAEAGDEGDDGRSLRERVQRRADLVVEHAAVVRRAETVVAVDHADGLEAAQAPHDLLGRERSEPPQADEAHLVALLAQPSDG